MTLADIDGLIWLGLALLPFIWAQRRLHYELQAVLLLIFRQPALSLGIFSFLFLPGVLLHEASHFFAARLLFVPIGRFSLTPKVLSNGTLRLGYLETGKVDFIRDALIGTAPLVVGGVMVGLIGATRLGLVEVGSAVGENAPAAVLESLHALPSLPDFWLWFYLAFTISSTMMPSASDRRAWLPVVLVFGAATALALMTGAGPWLVENASPVINNFLRAVALIFAISLGFHMLLLPTLFFIRRLLNHVTGLAVQ